MKREQHRIIVWTYPKTEDNAGPLAHGWRCSCGRYDTGFATQDAAQVAAIDHTKPKGG